MIELILVLILALMVLLTTIAIPVCQQLKEFFADEENDQPQVDGVQATLQYRETPVALRVEVPLGTPQEVLQEIMHYLLHIPEDEAILRSDKDSLH